jgi:hypothetical protein
MTAAAASPYICLGFINVRQDVLPQDVIADHYHRLGYTLVELWGCLL